ncbi:MAG: dethiobiotin synthase [Verrucomicrobiota bacterium]
MKRTFFITGTDTGTGKTVLTALLAHFLREGGKNPAAFKPVCSGGRSDALALQAALGGTLALDEINPWHFRAAIAPLLAARREKKTVTLTTVLAHLRRAQRRFEVVLVEGAGGLLSPLGEDFDSRDLLIALRAAPIIVAPNQLGAVNHLLLTLAALPKTFRDRAQIVLMTPAKPDAATTSNEKLLGNYFQGDQIFRLPWLGENMESGALWKQIRVRRVLARLMDAAFL